mmetsp:Transcript_20256/g.46756  ORF Transcript_20256/g.46756 Transcript_20256/m.46756 type:complete len:477 (-) Transcript_20256:991-2421(-)
MGSAIRLVELHDAHAVGKAERTHIESDDFLKHGCELLRARLVHKEHHRTVHTRIGAIKRCGLDQRAKRQQQFPLAHAYLHRVQVRAQLARRVHLQRGEHAARLGERVLHIREGGAVRVLVRPLVLLLPLAVGASAARGHLLARERLSFGLRLSPAPLALSLLALCCAHLVELLLGLCRRLQFGLVHKPQIRFDQAACCAHIKRVPPQPILEAQQFDICAQRHLPNTVSVEVELVLQNVGEVLLDGREIFERAAVVGESQIGLTRLELVPHALHVKEVGVLVAILGEESDGLCRLVNLVGTQHVARGLGVAVAVGEIHQPRLVHPLGRARRVTGMLVQARLEEVEVEAGGSVCNRAVYVSERVDCTPARIRVLRGKHKDPHERLRHLDLLAVRQHTSRVESGEPLANQLANLLTLVGAREQWLDICRERRHSLAQIRQRVRRKHLAKIGGVAREIEWEPPTHVRARKSLLQLCIELT